MVKMRFYISSDTYKFTVYSSILMIHNIKSKKGGEDQESIQSSTTPDPGYHMEKWQKHN